ncbi:MAG: glycosyltransferase family 1 protein [Ardenticatenales bacterium]|nr:glycosyltransferase family 1 protein [Ardenticatenales bacterium]MCB9172822.1 glycosyltransferase family 1 protein [Ardenticatenales bacterium]
MRIAFFSETFLPKVDGIVHTLCHLLDHLPSRGHHAILFAPAGAPRRYAQSRIHPMPALPCPIYPELKLAAPWADVLPTLEQFRPDLIHVLNPLTIGWVGLRAAEQLALPAVASYHTDIAGFAANWGFGYLGRPIWAALRWLHNRAALNLCPSRIAKQALERHGIERVRIWGRGVDSERFHPRHRSEAFRRRMGGTEAGPLFLYVGRLSHEKRIDLLHAVLTAMPEARLAIVGDGPARPHLEALFANSPARFMGYLRGDELAHAYASADYFLFPSPHETLGNVVLEAMASGLPVVVPNSGGVLEHVEHLRTGLLFTAHKPHSLVAAVQRLVVDKALAERLAASGRAHARQQSWANVHDQLIADYRVLLPTPTTLPRAA